MLFGYARARSRAALEEQCALLWAAGADAVYADEVGSGSRVERPEHDRLVATVLGHSDATVLVTSVAVWARTTRHLHESLSTLVSAGVTFRSLDEDWTLTPGCPVSQARLDGLRVGLDCDRALTSARSREAAAVNRIGRPRLLNAEQVEEALRLLEAGRAPALVAHRFGVSEKTIRRIAR